MPDETYYIVTGSDMTDIASTIRTVGGTVTNLTWPTGFKSAIQAISGGGSNYQTKTGTFTGDGTRQADISCNFEPDIVYWTSDPGTDASSGTVAGIIVRGLLEANRYRNNSTSNTNAIQTPITDMNTSGSSYNFRATYSNDVVSLYCFSNNVRSLFTNGRTYSYTFIKWTE